MFLYQTRLLKADVSNGVLESQFRMIDLYTSNLNAVGTQAALIASVSYLAIQNALTIVPIKSGPLAVIYQSLYAVSISSALIMVSHCVLASMLGPTKALIGNSNFLNIY